MNFLKTQLNLSASCHKQVANLNTLRAISPSISFKVTNLLFLLFALLLLLPGYSFAKEPNNIKDPKSVDDIIKLKQPPAGVVIEIVTWGGDNLEWALPRAKAFISKLRAKHPKLPVAIVTHGAEQFALTKDETKDNKEVHQLVKSLGNDDVPIHVCETFAGWRGLSADDFPKYVNVSAAGPAQVNDYIAIGYELILITDEE